MGNPFASGGDGTGIFAVVDANSEASFIGGQAHNPFAVPPGDSLSPFANPNTIATLKPAFVMLGQSLQSGYDSAANLTGGNVALATPYAAVPILAQQTVRQDPMTWYYYTAGQGSYSTTGPAGYGPVGPHYFPSVANDCAGPELAIARDLQTAFPDTFVLVKSTVDGSDLNTDWPAGSTFPTVPPNIWTITNTFLAAAQITVAGLDWEQAHNDAKLLAEAQAYAAHLIAFISALRAIYGNFPVIFGLLESGTTLTLYPYRDTVRAQQQYVATVLPYCTLINNDDLPLKADNTHRTADSTITDGHRKAAAFIAALATTTLSATLASSANPIVASGVAFNYLATVTNTGGTNAASVINYVVTLPSGVIFVSGSGTGWTISASGQLVTCTYASLATGTTTPTATISCTGPTGIGSGSITANGTVVAQNVVASTATSVTVTLTAPSVTKDGTSNVWLPQSQTEWVNFIAANSLSIGAPNALYLMQEASGNLADSIGSIPLTASGTNQAYQQAVSGWSTKSIHTINGATAAFGSTAAGLPSINTTSMLVLVLAQITSATSTRSLITLGTASFPIVSITTTPKVNVNDGANAANGANTISGAVRPFILKHDVTHAAAAGYTDTEKLVPTFSALSTGKQLVLGNAAGLNCAVADMLYCAVWFGSAAEMADAQVKALITAMGNGLWAPPWS